MTGKKSIASRPAGKRSRSASGFLSSCVCALPLLLAGCLSNSLTSLQVLPAAGSATVAVGQTTQFQALGMYTKSGHANTTQDITASVTWTSSATAIATINAAGLATGVSAGTATITATIKGPFGIVTGSSNITVTAAPGAPGGTAARVLTALTVSPGSQTITSTGQTSQLIAIGTYSAAPLTQDLSSTVTWQSSDVQVARVSSSGLVSGVGAGQTTITALATASNGSVITGSGIVTVNTAPSGRILTSLSIIPTSQTVSAAGETAQYIAIGTYSAAPLTVDLTDQVAWQSSDVKTGQVNPTGLVTGNGTGTTTITALATASDASVVPASATFQETVAAVGSVNLPTITIFKVGNGTGTVTGGTTLTGGVITGTVTINCGSGAGCIGTFPVGTKVFLVATTAASDNSVFDGWSNNCTSTDANGNPNGVSPDTSPYCMVTTNNTGNNTVGAIFDPTTP